MATEQEPLPIQPVEKPILCSPYAEPTEHWMYDTQTGEAHRNPGRRPASYWYKTQRTGSAQLSFLAEEERDDLPLVNLLREDVKRWRESNYEGATPITKQLLAHWQHPDRPRKLFFCQLEAAETIIYLTEILGAGKRPRWNPKLSIADYQALMKGERPSFAPLESRLNYYQTLVDIPNDGVMRPLTRYGCKMATGSGKTVVMAMLIAWTFCNRGRVPGDERFPSAVLVVCPNLTIKERLQVLRPDNEKGTYYDEFDLVPSQLRPLLNAGKVLVTNWHLFAPESPHSEGGKSYTVVNKGEESADAFARRVLGELYDRAPILVINDEAHHAYRPAPVPETEKLSAAEKAEREQATVWISGLDKINQACGVRFCVDLSATPFYLQGSGYIEGSPFPWLVSDFGLVDAIESGIVKIPRLPVSDTTGRPEAQYFRLWENKITRNLQPGQKISNKPKPEIVWERAQDALVTLASQWIERYERIKNAEPGKEQTPPVLIIVCDNTDIAELFYRNISGEETIEVEEEESEDENGNGASSKKKKTKTVYGAGKLFPEYFANREGFRPTLRIDSKLLAEAESEDPNATRKQAAEELRRIVATVGKRGEPGEQVRCIISVQMLTEGWDANNVTHILGLRAFGTQLLCEQVVGRGLRRMDYTPDPETGRLTEEYVDIYGVPFSVIPFKGRKTKAPAPEDQPKNHVRALPERAQFELRFPIVEGYAFALKRNLIKANIDAMEPLILEPGHTPTAVFVKPQVGYQLGHPTLGSGFQFDEHNREEYYKSTHLQTIKFEIARQVTWALTEGIEHQRPKLRMQSRHQLFPQVYRLVDEYVARKVNFHGCHPCELGLETYVKRTVERLLDAIQPNDEQGEPPLLPILNRYKPIGTTAEVDFKTTRPVFSTFKSHINQVVADTATWEQSAAFRLEQSPHVVCYARNDHLEFNIPYEYLGVSHAYEPDYIVRLANGLNVILEVKGYEDDQDKAKHQAARRWVDAVNNWGKLGKWRLHVCKDPQMLGKELEWIVGGVL